MTISRPTCWYTTTWYRHLPPLQVLYRMQRRQSPQPERAVSPTGTTGSFPRIDSTGRTYIPRYTIMRNLNEVFVYLEIYYYGVFKFIQGGGAGFQVVVAWAQWLLHPAVHWQVQVCRRAWAHSALWKKTDWLTRKFKLYRFKFLVLDIQPVPKAYRKWCVKFRSTPTLRSGLILV